MRHCGDRIEFIRDYLSAIFAEDVHAKRIDSLAGEGRSPPFRDDRCPVGDRPHSTHCCLSRSVRWKAGVRHEQSFADLLFGAGSKRRSALRYFENVRRGGVNL